MMKRMVPPVTWVWRAACVRMVDGDTLELLIDVGFRTQRRETVRLEWVDAPETIGVTRPAGLAATQFVRDWIAAAGAIQWPLIVETVTDERDRYGRWLMVIFRDSDGACLNDDIVTSGHARPWL
jgi:micrococcal nuclease